MRAPWKPARPLRARLRDVVLPATVTVTLAQRLYIERDGLPTVLIDALRRLAVFANPMFAERQAMRLSTGQTPRLITCFEDLPLHIALPRGTLDGARSLLGELGIELVLTDVRSSGSALRASFTGELSSEQTRADALARRAAHGSSRVLKGDPLRAPRPTRGGEALEWS
jgi:hypothetical protein